jgi:UDP-glucuronate decarboxylase
VEENYTQIRRDCLLRILVTGGAGFIGSHLIEKLLQTKNEVICVDNLFTGRKSSIQKFRQFPNFEFIRHDITFPLFVEVDGIFNLASPASPIWYQKFPVQTFKTNVHGSINILGLAKRLGVRVLQASTSEIYGDPLQNPQKENYWGNVNPIGLRSCYDEGKRAAETLFFDYHRQFGVDVRVARIFNTFGPQMDKFDGRVVSNFIYAALTGKDLVIYGDGTQTRSLCYVEDLVEALLLLFFKNSYHEPVNIGNPDPITIKELAQEIIVLTQSKSKISYEKLPSDDPKQRQPDISRATQDLGWKPKISRESGLIKTIDYFKDLIKAEK